MGTGDGLLCGRVIAASGGWVNSLTPQVYIEIHAKLLSSEEALEIAEMVGSKTSKV